MTDSRDILDLRERLKNANETERFEAIVDVLAGIAKDVNEIKISLEPIAKLYAGLVFGRSFIIGLAGLVAGIVGIGSGILWVFDFFKAKP